MTALAPPAEPKGQGTAAEAPLDTSSPLTTTCLIGAYAAIGAIPDAHLLVDAPDCAHLKAQFIHGNHDWMSTLVSISGYHRIANTALHCWKVIDKRDDPIVETLRRMGVFEGSGLVLMTSMPMATITGIDYDRLCMLASDASGTDTFHVVDKAIDGDWMDGYAQVLFTLARRMKLPKAARDAERDPKKVAIVGYFLDRNEEDHQGNLRELRRLIEALGLEVTTVWAGGEPWADMKRGIQEAGTLLSFPYARRAATLLGRRLDVPVVSCDLPFGLPNTIAWLEQLGERFDVTDKAAALIEREMRHVAPRLEFVVPFQFLHRRLVFIGDPHLADGFLDIAEDVGCKVSFLAVTARPPNARKMKRTPPPDTEVIIDPRVRAFHKRYQPASMGADLVVSCNVSMQSDEGYLEFGFPCYERHALYDRPFLGFRGFIAFVDDMARELRRVDQSKLRREEDRKRESSEPAPSPGVARRRTLTA